MGVQKPTFAMVRQLHNGIAPGDMALFKAESTSDHIKLYVTLPGSTVVENQTLVSVGGCVIRRSADGYPKTENDGDLVLELSADEVSKYTNGYEDTDTKVGTYYYYSAFPYSDNGVFNRGIANRASTSAGYAPDDMTSIKAVSKYNGTSSTVILTYEVPASTDKATLAGVIIRRSTAGYPATESDGDLVTTVTESGSYTDSGLTVGTTYYYSFFPYSDKSVYNRGEANRISCKAMGYYVMSVLINHDGSTTDPDKMVSLADDAADYAGNLSDDMPLIRDLKNCVLKDGEVLYYLNKDNIAQKEDGTAADITTLGNDVMLEVPYKMGYRIQWEGNSLRVSVTDDPAADGFKYDAFSLDAENDCDKIYIGRFEGNVSSSKLYSSSGKGVTVSQTIATFRTQARARGTGYQLFTNGCMKLYQALYLIRFASLNSQKTVGYGYVASGHSAGISTGQGNAYGFNSEIIKKTNPTYMTDQGHSVVCLGVENPWGNYWYFVDGIATNASFECMTTETAANCNNNLTGYTNNGNGGVTADSDGYISIPQGGNNAGFINAKVAGSDSTYYCDYSVRRASCLCILGGGWSSALGAGLFYLYLYNPFSLSNTNVGARLIYMHKAA